jgi:hypothetical protein
MIYENPSTIRRGGLIYEEMPVRKSTIVNQCSILKTKFIKRCAYNIACPSGLADKEQRYSIFDVRNSVAQKKTAPGTGPSFWNFFAL